MPDTYASMTALYADPSNVEGETYGKRWRRHEWSQTVEEQATDNPETQKIVLAIHAGGIEKSRHLGRRVGAEHLDRTPLVRHDPRLDGAAMSVCPCGREERELIDGQRPGGRRRRDERGAR